MTNAFFKNKKRVLNVKRHDLCKSDKNNDFLEVPAFLEFPALSFHDVPVLFSCAVPFIFVSFALMFC